MEITRAQVAQTLGCPIGRINALVAQGRLTPLNRPADGRRYVARFDDAAVRALKREHGTTNGHGPANGHERAPMLPIMPSPARRQESAIQAVVAFAQVDADKRDILLKLAARYSAQDLALLLDL